MDADAKRDVRVFRTVENDVVRVLEDARVAVRGGEVHQHFVAFVHRAAGVLRFFGDVARHRVARETGGRVALLRPEAVGALPLDQKGGGAADGRMVNLAGREQREQRPGGLRGRARRGLVAGVPGSLGEPVVRIVLVGSVRVAVVFVGVAVA